jgi:hypothetical protein
MLKGDVKDWLNFIKTKDDDKSTFQSPFDTYRLYHPGDDHHGFYQ